MSHVMEIRTRVRNLSALVIACRRLGWRFVEGQQRYAWYGTLVGDAPLPQGVRKEELGACDHAIRVPKASYEIGVKLMSDGDYTLLCDTWPCGGLPRDVSDQLTQAYVLEDIRMRAEEKGYVYTEDLQPNGDVCVKLLESY